LQRKRIFQTIVQVPIAIIVARALIELCCDENAHSEEQEERLWFAKMRRSYLWMITIICILEILLYGLLGIGLQKLRRLKASRIAAREINFIPPPQCYESSSVCVSGSAFPANSQPSLQVHTNNETPIFPANSSTAPYQAPVPANHGAVNNFQGKPVHISVVSGLPPQ
ncbi:hypothetical protein OESDEN_02759, partial [Oesophagostomum dentatum]